MFWIFYFPSLGIFGDQLKEIVRAAIGDFIFQKDPIYFNFYLILRWGLPKSSPGCHSMESFHRWVQYSLTKLARQIKREGERKKWMKPVLDFISFSSITCDQLVWADT